MRRQREVVEVEVERRGGGDDWLVDGMQGRRLGWSGLNQIHDSCPDFDNSGVA